jgi:hypothetical protein
MLLIRGAQLLVENMTQLLAPEIYNADFCIKLCYSRISSHRARRMATCCITLILYYLVLIQKYLALPLFFECHINFETYFLKCFPNFVGNGFMLLNGHV